MGRHGPKCWASTEQVEFLLSRLSQYIECQQNKVYKPFLTNTWNIFEARWPEYNYAHSNIPVEGDLTVDEIKVLTIVKSKHKLMIQTWYRWQTNAMCLVRSGGLKGALGLSETLSRGDEVLGQAPQEVEVYSHIFYNEHVKGEADVAIKAEGISTHGKKLARWKDLTHVKYAAEDDDIRAEVQEKHQEALASWKEKRGLARAGFVQEVEQKEKIKALNELGAHLDHIFCHLSHKTGGFKFTCITGGQDPTMGDIIVLNYHLGETDIGSEFSAQYTGFGEVQTAYADFVKLALAHDDNMQALADAGNADEVVDNNSDREPNELDEIFGLGSQADKEKDDYMSAIDSSMGTGITSITTVPNSNVTPLNFNQLDLSSLDMADVETFFNSLPCDPFTASGPSTLEDLNFSFMHNFSRSSDFSYLLPPFAGEPMLPAFAGNMFMHSTTPPPHSDYQLPTTPLSASGINVIDSNTRHELLMSLPVGPQQNSTDPLSITPLSTSGINVLDSNLNTCHNPLTSLRVGLQEDPGGPRQTTCHHIPSTHEHVLNAIGSSGAHVHPPVSVGKENNKQKGKSTGTEEQSRK
ncbi:hypothetical protein EDB19DRAFT_1904772 [Suillus lakei]|nr:hypothetical protein EDB19DRAFT_1904772 [Suillus lakei]